MTPHRTKKTLDNPFVNHYHTPVRVTRTQPNRITMPKILERTQFSRPQKSGFDLSREQKLSCRMGDLIPTYLEEVVPGDEFKVTSEVLVRLAPMLAPVMHRVDLFMHYFFVPNRIIWNQWESFITGGRLGTDAPTMPTIAWSVSRTAAQAKLGDYLGLPALSTLSDANSELVSRLPFKAYLQIYNDYYRDQNLQAEIDLTVSNNYVIQKRAWEKDYFTSALPFTQRGPAVGAPLTILENSPTIGTPSSQGLEVDITGDLVDTNGNPVTLSTINATNTNLNINELRRTTAIQRWLEKSALGGSRYAEQLLSFFGVKPQDARLQRAEYLGGGKQPIIISEVLNTTGTTDAPQGDMTGHGISSGATNTFKFNVPEHGYIMGIMSVLPRSGYQQGIPKHYSRKTKFDYYFPEFARLGEQEVKNKELYYQNNQTNNEAVFGYQQRYAEYKHGNSSVHGEFRTTLDYWHMGRIFTAAPALNQTFVQMDTTYRRVFATQYDEGDDLWCQLYHEVHARRPMPHFSNPQLQ